MKRLCAILLGLMMLAGLCACGRRTSPAPAPKTLHLGLGCRRSGSLPLFLVVRGQQLFPIVSDE